MAKTPRERKEEAAELVANGWKAMGDLPYHIARSLDKSSGTVATFTRRFFDEILSERDDTYRRENVKHVGVKIFVSQDLATKIEAEVEKYYAASKRSL